MNKNKQFELNEISIYKRLFVTFLQVPLLFYFLSKSTENFRAITSLKTSIVIKCKPIWNSFKRKKCDFFGVETICKLPTQPHLYSQLYIYIPLEKKNRGTVFYFIALTKTTISDCTELFILTIKFSNRLILYFSLFFNIYIYTYI